MGGVGADGLSVQLPDEVRSGQAAHLQVAKKTQQTSKSKFTEYVNAGSYKEGCFGVVQSLLVFVGENEYISCMCSAGAMCVYREHENHCLVNLSVLHLSGGAWSPARFVMGINCAWEKNPTPALLHPAHLDACLIYSQISQRRAEQAVIGISGNDPLHF